MTAPTEKAAPIPADVLALADVLSRCVLQNLRFTQPVIRDLVARAIMQDLADREARPSLPNSREEQIRAEAAEDERDRLYAEACRPVPDNEENETVAALACPAATWLRLTQGVQPTARARQGGNNG